MSDADVTYLLGIGDFSRFTMLSVRMLRHYDERGVLVPAYIDPLNGYRFYSLDQLKTAGKIRTLRDAGCGITQISQLLPLFDNTDALMEALREHARSLDAAAQQIADQQSLLNTILSQIKEPTMPITVERRTFAPMRTLMLRRTVANFAAEAELWQDFGQIFTGPNAVPMSKFGRTWGATYFDTDYRDTDVDIAVWAEFAEDIDLPEGFAFVEMPEHDIAWATMYGSYDQMGPTCEAIGTWISTHGHTMAGPMFNIYIVSAAVDPNPENWVTQVCFPIA
jgi:DNA-binding transcriptional MerR regulator